MALIALENCFLVTVPDTFLALAFTCALLRHNDKKTQKKARQSGRQGASNPDAKIAPPLLIFRLAGPA